jgi:monoamine oxidase
MPPDVLILGAGVAGLSAAIELARGGLRVEILEARDRIGGRVFTQHDPTLNHPVELGAEFVHGIAPEIWLPAQQHNLKMTEVDGDLWCSLNGKLRPCNFFRQADKILAAMNDRDPDESFLDFLKRRLPGGEHKNDKDNDKDEDAKRWATGYVSGFNAADPGEVSVHWLVHGRKADEQIEGDRAFHIAGGYQKLLGIFAAELTALNVPIHLNTVVNEIKWSKQFVQVKTSGDGVGADRDETRGHVATGALTRQAELSSAQRSVGRSSATASFTAPRALITLPLGVLQSGSIRFDPQLPAEKQTALQKLSMGKVVRVTFCFRERFWAGVGRAPSPAKAARDHGARTSAKGGTRDQDLSNLSFLFSRDPLFPTWWTQMPEELPIITGWAPAHSAESLTGMSEGRIVDKALDTLSGLLGIDKARIQAQLIATYFHDWNSDPFSCGAYSYVRAGGEGCQKILAAPLENTLFFAGEATDITGHNGTVHGAIASGQRAAKEILAISRG